MKKYSENEQVLCSPHYNNNLCEEKNCNKIHYSIEYRKDDWVIDLGRLTGFFVLSLY